MTKNPQRKGAHHTGAYQKMARQVVLAARADVTTRCWRCGLMLHEHAPHKNGRLAFWTAGHVVTGEVLSPLLPEASTCNFTAGGRTGAARTSRAIGTRAW